MQLNGIKSQIVDRLHEASYSYGKDLKRINSEPSYEIGFGEYTFTYDGNKVVYKYEGDNFVMYKNGTKVPNSASMESINREIQDIFPQASDVTDRMLRTISEIRMDNQINPDDPFELPLDKNSIPDRAEIPAKKEEKSEFDELLAKLEITDDEPEKPELTEEEKAERKRQIDELTASLEIKDDPEVRLDPITGKKILTKEEAEERKRQHAEMLAKLTITDEPEKMIPEGPIDPGKLSQIQETTAKLEITDEPVEHKRDVKDMDVARIQERMDYLMKNPAVIEYIELQDMMKSYYDEYTEAVSQNIEQEQAREILPDVILK